MSMGSFNILGSAAGVPYAQNNSSDVQRASQDSNSQKREQMSADKAESAAGIGETDSDQATEDRDADGRKIWEAAHKKEGSAEKEQVLDQEPRSRDATDTRGNHLDLTG